MSQRPIQEPFIMAARLKEAGWVPTGPWQSPDGKHLLHINNAYLLLTEGVIECPGCDGGGTITIGDLTNGSIGEGMSREEYEKMCEDTRTNCTYCKGTGKVLLKDGKISS